MPAFTLEADVAAAPDVLFDALTTPARLQRWLYGTEAIAEVSGPLAQPGTTFVQRAIKGIQRPGGVVAADRPRLWHIRLVGMGERADILFELEPSAAGTRLQLTVDVRNGPRLIGPIVDRLSAGVERRLWQRVLTQIQEEIAREKLTPVTGEVYLLEGGGWLRVAQVIDADDTHVHLQLRAGTCRTRPAEFGEVDLAPRRLRDHLDVQPLEPTLRSAASVVQVGSNALMADGGHGVAHCPMTATEFRNARPQLLGIEPVDQDVGEHVDWWRERRGAAFGDRRPPTIGAYFSVSLQAWGVDALGFGLVKLLKQGFGGVHVRVYSNTWTERPTSIEERTLESRPPNLAPLTAGEPLTEPPASHHLALKHATFTSVRPEFLETALVEPDELVPIEAWKLGKGAFT